MSNYPALFLTTSLHQAVWYQVEEQGLKMTRLDEYEKPKETFSDNEGFFGNAGKGSTDNVGAPDIMNSERAHAEKTFVSDVCEKTQSLLKQNQFNYFLYTTPDRIKNEIKESLGADLEKIANKYLAGNFMKAPIKKLQELFKKSLQAF